MSKVYITRLEWANGKKEKITFDREWAQAAHTGQIWDKDLMDLVKWIDYDEVDTDHLEDLRISLADILEMSSERVSKVDLYASGKNRIDEHGYLVPECELVEVVNELVNKYYK